MALEIKLNMKVKKVSSLATEKWAELLEPFDYLVYHTLDCISSIHNLSEIECNLYRFTLGKSSAIVPLISRSFEGQQDLVTPYGYSGIIFKNFSNLLLNKIYNYFCSQSFICSYIVNSPISNDLEPMKHSSFYDKNSCFIIDCSLSIESLTTNIVGRRRSQVKLKNDCEFIYEKKELKGEFLKLYKLSMQAKEVSGYHLFSDDMVNSLISSSKTFLIGLKSGGKLLSISLFGRTDYACDFILNGATHDGRKFSSAILWEAVKITKSNKIPYFNLGGGLVMNDSLDQYKSKFGGFRKQFGAFREVHDKVGYSRILEQKNIELDDNYNGFFPAYRKV